MKIKKKNAQLKKNINDTSDKVNRGKNDLRTETDKKNSLERLNRKLEGRFRKNKQ